MDATTLRARSSPRRPGPGRRWLARASACALALAGAAGAQVRINELVAGRSDRLLQWDANGVPRIGAGPAWYEAAFDDRNWTEAAGPLGYGDSGLATNLQSVMLGKTPALYIRRTFAVSAQDAARTNTLSLAVDFDDGFIAYLNGREVGRKNMGAAKLIAYCDQQAFNAREAGTAVTLALGAASGRLVAGANVLAIQVHNLGPTDADLQIAADLTMAGTPVRQLVRRADAWRYVAGLYEPSGGERDPAVASGATPLGVSWASPYFDDSAWLRGPGGLGYGDGDDATVVDAAMKGKALALYLRRAFAVSAASAARLDAVQLVIDYDDGFVAYLNGVEVARRNLGAAGEFIAFDRAADDGHEAGTAETITLGNADNLLRAGTNVLAIQVHNDAVNSSDLSLIADLNLTGSPAEALVRHGDTWAYAVGTAEPSELPDPPPAERDTAFMDWVELFNAGAAPVSLDGWSLTDDRDAPAQWVFPNLTLQPGQHLVVFCSGLDRRSTANPYLHTNFKLNRGGDYLGLYNAAGTVVSELAPEYPAQSRFHSYGWHAGSGTYRHFATPTPGAANIEPSYAGRCEPPTFGREAAFYAATTTVPLATPTPGATIRYTTDGTEPTATNGTAYTAAIAVSASTALRARAFKDGWVPSETVTRTFVVGEPSGVRALPALSLVGDWRRSIHKPYGVTSIVGGSWVSSLWVAGTTEDYNIPMEHGRAFERPISLECLWPDGAHVQVDCGLRLAGSAHIRPRYVLQNMTGRWNDADQNKPQFNVYFRDDYGDGILDFPLFRLSPIASHDSLRLRGGKNDDRNPFVRDELTRRLYRDMGQVSCIGMLAAIYCNGQFKGYYNPCERVDPDFLQRAHRGGSAWDIVNHDATDVSSGDTVAWLAAGAYADTHNLSVLANYQAMAAQLDVENFADYLILNAFVAMWDWPQNNWYAARERAPHGKFRYYVWDAEGACGTSGYNPSTYNSFTADLGTKTDRISKFYRALKASPEFRLLCADRVRRHFFDDGALLDSRIRQRFEELRAELNPMVQYYWGADVATSWLNNWLAVRRNVFFSQLRTEGLWSDVVPPAFAHPGGTVPGDFAVALSGITTGAYASARIYYTIDGTDPRAAGGAAQGTLYAAPFRLDRSRTVRARTLLSGAWSPLVQATYVSGLPPLVVSEIHYAPREGGDGEFIELQNTGASAISLAGMAFTEGIAFDFDYGSVAAVPPGGYVVVVRSRAAFAARYGTNGIAVAGEFTGKLDDAGERLTLAHDEFGTILAFAYSDDWYPHTDGEGFSLTVRNTAADTAAWSLKSTWRASAWPGGSPGTNDAGRLPEPGTVVIHELLAHTDASPVGDWLELRNTSEASVDIGGWYLSDSGTNLTKYRIADGTCVAPGGYVVFSARDHFQNPASPQPFAFSENGDEAYLSSGTNAAGELTGYRESVDFEASEREVPFGLHARSDGKADFVALRAATPGGPNAPPKIGPLVFAEILYAPAEGKDEFLELYNITGAPVPLYDPAHPANTWLIGGGVDFVFPSGITVPAHGSLIVAPLAPRTFRIKYGLGPTFPVYGPYTGLLNNAGESIKLYKPTEPDPGLVPYVRVEKVEYDDAAPWPVLPAGEGRSLERCVRAAHGNDPANWAPSVPGGTLLPAVHIDSDGDALPDGWESGSGFDAADAADAAGDPDGDGASTGAEYVAGTDPRDAASVLTARLDVAGAEAAVAFDARAAAGAGYAGLVRLYALQRSTNAAAGWTGVAGRQSITGTGQRVTLRDPLATNAPAFYRIGARLVAP